MKIIMYGTEICPECVEAKKYLMNNNTIELDYRCITEKIEYFKEFLSYRDKEEMFAPIKDNGKIGIPFFILEDGIKTLEIPDFVHIRNHISDEVASSCSIDGRGNC